MKVFFSVASFSLLVLLQSFAINGIKICFQEGMIFFRVGVWLKENTRKKWVLKPLLTCINCMSSLWGSISFLSVVMPVYGFRKIEIIALVWDIFILVSLNGYIYKKV